MRLRVLGCSGGIGTGLRTTSMLLDGDILVDAGTGVGDLSLEEMSRIDHAFITHSHLDHIAGVPLMLDTVGGMRDRPLTVYALAETISALREHVFNWTIWPDFSQIPDPDAPYLRFRPIKLGETVDLAGRRITALPARHVVPAVGYRLDSGAASLVFSGDTIDCDAFWETVNGIANLRYLLIETAFSDQESDIALAAKHYWPALLAREMAKLERRAVVYITHLGPGDQELIMEQILRQVAPLRPRMLRHDDIFEF